MEKVSVYFLGLATALLFGVPSASATSPGRDGRIAFTNDDGLVTARPNGSDAKAIAPGAGNPRWSADGSLIAYRRGPGIYVARSDGSNPRTVFFGRSDGGFAFAPDGRTIVIRRVEGSPDNESSNLYKVDVATGREDLLARGGEHPIFSPDGRSVAFVHSQGLGISTVRLDGTGRTRVFRGHSVESLDWSPGGRSIAFVQFFSKRLLHENGEPYRRYFKDLRVIGVRSGHIKRLVRRAVGSTSLESVSWSPTGRRLLLSMSIDQRGALFMVGARTARVVRIGVEGFTPAWQPLPE
jgi:Tol biopolymer transport system component